MKRLSAIVFVLILASLSHAQQRWTRTYGETLPDAGYSVQQTTDGGYVIAGQTTSFASGSSDIYIIKTNATGDTLWTRTYGGTSPDIGRSIQQTADGGYIVAGATMSFGSGAFDVWLIKTDANGNVGVEGKSVSSPVSRLPLTVRPNPFTSFASVPGHSAERFALYDITGRMVGTCLGNCIGEGLVPGVYFFRPEKGDLKPLRVMKVR